jgi:phage terminase small subunit
LEVGVGSGILGIFGLKECVSTMTIMFMYIFQIEKKLALKSVEEKYQKEIGKVEENYQKKIGKVEEKYQKEMTELEVYLDRKSSFNVSLILDQKFGRKGHIHQGNGQFEGTT